MKIQKIPKEEWLKLSQEERDYITLRFNDSIEKRKRIALFVTRGIAIFCVFALFFIGYAQLEASRSYGAIKDQYGKDAYCYLCGVESLRKCECIYWSQGTRPENMTEYKLNLGNYNTQVCKGMHVEQGNMPDKNFIPINLTI
jgi:hypothetical protein